MPELPEVETYRRYFEETSLLAVVCVLTDNNKNWCGRLCGHRQQQAD